MFYFEFIINNNNTLVCIFYKNEYKMNNYLSVIDSMTISIDQIFNSKTGANTHII